MMRSKVLLAAALLVGGAAACTDLTGITGRADGVYLLQTVNGTVVPYSYTDSQTGNTVTVLSDTYSINSDGTYSEFATYRVFNGSTNSNQSQTESGTWSQSTSFVSFFPTQSSVGALTSYQGTIANNNAFGGTRTLTISLNGSTAIYSE